MNKKINLIFSYCNYSFWKSEAFLLRQSLLFHIKFAKFMFKLFSSGNRVIILVENVFFILIARKSFLPFDGVNRTRRITWKKMSISICGCFKFKLMLPIPIECLIICQVPLRTLQFWSILVLAAWCHLIIMSYEGSSILHYTYSIHSAILSNVRSQTHVIFAKLFSFILLMYVTYWLFNEINSNAIQYVIGNLKFKANKKKYVRREINILGHHVPVDY